MSDSTRDSWSESRSSARPPGTQHPSDLDDRGLRVGHVLEHPLAPHHVDARVRQRELGGQTLAELHPDAGGRRPLLGHRRSIPLGSMPEAPGRRPAGSGRAARVIVAGWPSAERRGTPRRAWTSAARDAHTRRAVSIDGADVLGVQDPHHRATASSPTRSGRNAGAPPPPLRREAHLYPMSYDEALADHSAR